MRKKIALGAIFALCLLLVPALPQNISGTLTGTVKDPAGSVVPNAQVTLTNQDTGASQAISSNDAGMFVFPSVLPGTYTVGVTMAGFRSYQVRDIAITQSDRRSLGDIVLQVGQVQERVEVTAEVTPVQTASSERAGLVAGTQLQNTAIRGRDFVALIATLPGIYDANSQSRSVSKGPGAGGLHINGGRDTSINFFPLPNYTETDPSLFYRRNYRSHQRRARHIHQLLAGRRTRHRYGLEQRVSRPAQHGCGRRSEGAHQQLPGGIRPQQRRHHQRHRQEWHPGLPRKRLLVLPQ
ncbi:MAG: carboxypeptidase-like regulatory domain-containing protein [Acidobacteria bacterium]|nr:carboxypeptidase-like regulatory domain-containing protein [Acidobacteriota bacterium]